MSKIIKDKARQALNLAMKQFTRAKALRALNAGNCEEKRFTDHPNKHVKARAAHLAARNAPPVTEEAAPETMPEEAAA